MLTRWKYKPENSWNGNRNGCPDYPEVQARAQTHLRETEGQLNRLEQCLSSMGESSSTLKDTTQSVTGEHNGARPFDGRRRNPQKYLCQQRVRAFRDRRLQIPAHIVWARGSGQRPRSAGAVLEGGGSNGGMGR